MPGRIVTLMLAVLLLSLAVRTPFKVDVVRDRAALARIVAGGKLENIYRLQIMNATESTQHYKITASGLDQLRIEEDDLDENQTIAVEPAQSRWISVRLEIPDGSQSAGSHPVYFNIRSVESKETITEKSVFLVPR